MFDPVKFLHSFIDSIAWQVRVKVGQSFPEPVQQEDIGIGGTLRRRTVRRDIRAEAVIIAEFLQPSDGGPFQFVFGEMTCNQSQTLLAGYYVLLYNTLTWL